MQPLTLTLPNEIRDALERDFPAHKLEIHPTQLGRYLLNESAAQQWVADHLFPEHPTPKLHEFTEKFQNAFAGMATGDGSPVVVLRNLPEQSGPYLMDGLGKLLGGQPALPSRYSSVQERNRQRLHHDIAHHGPQSPKPVVFLYCGDPGHVRQPTNFVSADEVLTRLADEKKIDRKFLIAELESTIMEEPTYKGSAKRYYTVPVPFLTRNPNFQPENGAVEFFAAWPGRKPLHPLIVEFAECAEKIGAEITPSSQANTEKNSLVMFSDKQLIHGRAGIPDTEIQLGRELRVARYLSRVVLNPMFPLEFQYITNGPVQGIPGR